MKVIKEDASAEKWGRILEQIRNLDFAQSTLSERFERQRKKNIENRYTLLKEALSTSYATEQTLGYIAELGIEFESGKAYAYLGGSPFGK